MRIAAACSLGGAGHLYPLVPFLSAAARRGDEVVVVGPPAIEGLVKNIGHAFHAGDEPPEATVALIRERLPGAAPEEALVLGNRDLFGRLAAPAMVPAMEEICRGWKPDLILRDPCEYASVAVAHAAGIPTAQVAISLADAEATSIAAASPALEDLRAGLSDEIVDTLYLSRLPEVIDPSPFPKTTRFHEAFPDVPAALPTWWPDDGRPLVYATFGTVLGHMSVAGDVYAAALAALADLPVRALLTVGWNFDPHDLTDVPENVHIESWVEHPRVFRQADLVVCHGGSGTAYGALAAGRPLVLVPLFADQFENSRRIVDAGAGISAAPHPDEIAAAIRTVLDAPRFRDRAERIAAGLMRTLTVDDVLAELTG